MRHPLLAFGSRCLALAVLCCAVVLFAAPLAAAEFQTLKGHGGPVMDIAVDRQTGSVATASFDNSVGVWSGRTPVWLDGHEAAVKAVAFIDASRIVSAGDDNAVILWDRRDGTGKRLEGHTAKVQGLAVSPDKSLIASASWDARIGLWPTNGGEPMFLTGHGAGVNQVAFAGDGRWLYSASMDGSVILWDVASRSEKRVIDSNGFGINVLSVGGRIKGSKEGPETWLAYGSQDGVTRILDLQSGARLFEFSLDRRPILAMDVSPDGSLLATGDGQGYITVFDTRTWSIETDFRAALKGPVWALAFSNDGTVLHAGGIEDIVYSWPVEDLAGFDPMASQTPEFLRDPDAMPNGERQFARKCSICHSLARDGARRAGPSLYNVFGRKVGTLPGYRYSATLEQSDIIWSEATIGQLFLDGPDHYIPGSKMPMQRILSGQDRKDLVDFLKSATALKDAEKGQP